MKPLTALLLSFSLLSTQLFAADTNINPDTARAYEGYLITFLWPDGQSSEQIDYKNILSSAGILRLPTDNNSHTELEPSAALPSNTDGTTPFGNIDEKLGQHVTILVNQKWTLLFKQPGDSIEKAFHSIQVKDGYPELTGGISIKLGRYLESDIQYKHYLFDSFSQPETNTENGSEQSSSFQVSQHTPIVFFTPQTASEDTNLKSYEPALVLNLNLHNKTASKKINYLDHPTIGTLLYFEPIELQDAIERLSSDTVAPETGQSLNYDELQSTNELRGINQPPRIKEVPNSDETASKNP